MRATLQFLPLRGRGTKARSGLVEGYSPLAASRGENTPPPPSFARRSPSPSGGGIGQTGFSLVEALVALAILAIAAVGLTRAVESHIDSTRGLERRVTAMWVAENRLAELELGGVIAREQQVEMLGQKWRVAVAEERTDDPEIVKVRINVFGGAERSPLASLDGFVDGRRS